MIQFIKFEKEEWPQKVAQCLINAINKVLILKDNCNMIITGGSIVKSIYIEMAELLNIPEKKSVNFYLSDERFGHGSIGRKNNEMILQTLFSKDNLKSNIKFHVIKSYGNNYSLAASNYDFLLPKDLDISLLTVAIDGHIASIFPKSKLLKDIHSRVAIIFNSEDNTTRITIGPKLLSEVKNHYLLAPGKNREIYLKNRDIYTSEVNQPTDLIKIAKCFIHD